MADTEFRFEDREKIRSPRLRVSKTSWAIRRERRLGVKKKGRVRSQEEGGGKGRIKIVFLRRPEGGFMRAVCVLCPCASLILSRRAPLFNSRLATVLIPVRPCSSRSTYCSSRVTVRLYSKASDSNRRECAHCCWGVVVLGSYAGPWLFRT